LANNFTLNAVINFAVTDFQTPIVGANAAAADQMCLLFLDS